MVWDSKAVAAFDLVNHLENFLIPEVEARPGSFEYATFAWGVYAICLDLAMTQLNGPVRMLDAGSGIGTKLLYSEMLHPRIQGWGVEIEPAYLRLARKLLPAERFIEADLRTWRGYSAFDLVYCYRPYIDYELQRQLERRMLSEMRSGSVLILVGLFHSGEGWRQLDEKLPVWRKD